MILTREQVAEHLRRTFDAEVAFPRFTVPIDPQDDPADLHRYLVQNLLHRGWLVEDYAVGDGSIGGRLAVDPDARFPFMFDCDVEGGDAVRTWIEANVAFTTMRCYHRDQEWTRLLFDLTDREFAALNRHAEVRVVKRGPYSFLEL